MILEILLATTIHGIDLPGGEWNQIHPTIRIQEEQFIAGAYLNSVNTLSLYAGVELNLNEDFHFEIGAVSGYSEGLLPFVRFVYDINDTTEVFLFPVIVTNYDGSLADFGVGVGLSKMFGKYEF